MTVLTLNFADKMKWDGASKTAISVRDGVLEYYGHEIGQEPADKVFTVYRSPATIANVRDMMADIPLTNDHVDTDEAVAEPVGKVTSASVIDLFDDVTDARIGIKNTVDVSDEMLAELELGKRELSLGYKAELIPHDKYDFEQTNITPHHLAVVDAGRCGAACSFLDKKTDGVIPMKKKKVSRTIARFFRDNIKRKKPVIAKSFLDEDGQPNLQQVVEIAQQIPEALKALPMDELQKVLPVLQQVIVESGASSASEIEEEILDEEEMLDEEEEILDEDKEEGLLDEDKEEMKDEEAVKEKFADSKSFKDAVASAITHHTAVVEKARDFLDDGYNFIGKTTQRVMRDALASEHGSQSFSDSELSVAFKMMKKSQNQLQNFGDATAHNGLEARIRKSLEG